MPDQPPKLNLNTASARDIARLPGMTDRLAQRVVRYRERNGLFQDISQLQNVRGFDPAPLEQVKDLAFVDPAAAQPGGVLAFAKGQQPDQPGHVFTGAPQFLQSEIALLNTGSDVTRLAPIKVENSSLRAAGGQLLTEISVHAILKPGEQSRSSVSIALDPGTPPGVYQAELVLQGERRPVVFNVAERIRTQVNPSSLVLLESPGSKVEKTVFVTNGGNIPLRGGDVGAIILEPDHLECRVARNSVKQLKSPTWDQFVGAVSEELKSAFAEIEPLRIRAKSKPSEILPGDTGTFVLEFQLPKSAKPGFSYHGLFHIFDAAVGVVLVPGPEIIVDATTPTTAPASQAPAAQTKRGTIK